MGFFSLPFISQFGFWTQFTILSFLLLASYFHRTIRLVVATLVSCSIALKIIIPLTHFIIYLLKGIAWLGFYLFFIQHAFWSALQGIVWVFDVALPWVAGEMLKAQNT